MRQIQKYLFLALLLMAKSAFAGMCPPDLIRGGTTHCQIGQAPQAYTQCPAGQHWATPRGFAICVADGVPGTPPTPPSQSIVCADGRTIVNNASQCPPPTGGTAGQCFLMEHYCISGYCGFGVGGSASPAIGFLHAFTFNIGQNSTQAVPSPVSDDFSAAAWNARNYPQHAQPDGGMLSMGGGGICTAGSGAFCNYVTASDYSGWTVSCGATPVPDPTPPRPFCTIDFNPLAYDADSGSYVVNSASTQTITIPKGYELSATNQFASQQQPICTGTFTPASNIMSIVGSVPTNFTNDFGRIGASLLSGQTRPGGATCSSSYDTPAPGSSWANLGAGGPPIKMMCQ